ncbi:MAG: CHAT domain-containing protein, partial [Chloroflexi bacterium]|nr:CHAT domain-containing protein [Chloroflexota bacterium]
GESVRAFRLSAKMLEVEGLLQRFSVNINMLSRSASHFGSLLENAQGILKRLNNLLLAPFREILSNYAKLIIVPHGALHYLPFHALYDGETYLIQTHQVSYLPASSFMRHCREAKIAPRGLLAVGHSYNGHLPHAVEEAKIVADLWGEQPLLEEAATLRELQGKFSQYRILHLACHGDFRADNPLFSGLAFENDW